MRDIKIKLDDQEIKVNKDEHFSLLTAMERNKLPIKYGCLMGVCGVCEVKVVKGMDNIEYFEEPMLELDKDSIFPCCCKAKGNVELKNI